MVELTEDDNERVLLEIMQYCENPDDWVQSTVLSHGPWFEHKTQNLSLTNNVAISIWIRRPFERIYCADPATPHGKTLRQLFKVLCERDNEARSKAHADHILSHLRKHTEAASTPKWWQFWKNL